MCHIRTQNTNKMLRAICQRQKAMVRAYLSMKNEMTLALRKINIFGFWPFPFPLYLFKFFPSCSKVFVPFFPFQTKSQKIIYSLAAYFLSSYYFLVLFGFLLPLFYYTLHVSLWDVGYFEMGFRLFWQGLILFSCVHITCLPLCPLLPPWPRV